jgi:capsule polysaccharide modification protein KpsS
MVKIQFSPSGMMDLHSWSKIVQMKPSKIVEEAVYRITSLHVESDPKLKGFWETQISPQISLILKAVA